MRRRRPDTLQALSVGQWLIAMSLLKTGFLRCCRWPARFQLDRPRSYDQGVNTLQLRLCGRGGGTDHTEESNLFKRLYRLHRTTVRPDLPVVAVDGAIGITR